MFKQVIVGVDFSEAWQELEKRLQPLLQLLGVQQVTLVYVHKTLRWQKESPEEGASQLSHLRQLAEDLGKAYGLPVAHEFRRGMPASELIECARERQADGVIVGNSSHSVYRDFILGNVTLNVARLAQIPEVVLPVDATGTTEQSPLLLATDGSEAASRAESLFAGLIGGHNSGEVVMVSDGDSEPLSPEELEKGRAMADSLGKDMPLRTLQGDPATELTRYARECSARLMVMGKRGETDMRELPLGSTAESVLRLAVTPVMLVPQHIVRS
ncbi:MAG: universal stress protein [Oleiphilaceae bacterium]|nr:universal stress protein [Oleiphilaceae bacterium]